ncbi:MAG: hypothetical protein M3P42_04805 [Actinomycetota bacterium]|nr:hypothetical protein [Actinomycetota bacterium]
MDDQTREPEEKEKQELDDLEPAEKQADAVKGGASDGGHAGEIIIESRRGK